MTNWNWCELCAKYCNNIFFYNRKFPYCVWVYRCWKEFLMWREVAIGLLKRKRQTERTNERRQTRSDSTYIHKTVWLLKQYQNGCHSAFAIAIVIDNNKSFQHLMLLWSRQDIVSHRHRHSFCALYIQTNELLTIPFSRTYTFIEKKYSTTQSIPVLHCKHHIIK